MKFLLSKRWRDKSHILDKFNSAMMVTRYDDIMAHNRLMNLVLIPLEIISKKIIVTNCQVQRLTH